MLKEFLSEKGISYQDRDVSRNPAYAQELVNNTRQMGVPVTIIDGQIVIGFDRERLEQLLQRPAFGASVADASRITAGQASGIIFGAYVGKVRPGSVAQRAGILSGDIITEFNMKHITNAANFEQAVAGMRRGSRFSLVFTRGKLTMTAEGTF